MVITGFEKKGRKILVRFDDYSSIVLNYEIFLKNGLKINSDLSESRLNLLRDENIKYEIKQTAFSLLSRRLHSSSELITKLKQKYHHAEFIEETVNNLIQNNYLDDAKFAAEFIEEKGKVKLWGSRKIKMELRKRGVANTILNDESVETRLEDSSESLEKAARKKYKLLQNRNLPEDKLKQKLITYLIGKGFEYDEIKIIVNNLIK
jgi:regulatory protein